MKKKMNLAMFPKLYFIRLPHFLECVLKLLLVIGVGFSQPFETSFFSSPPTQVEALIMCQRRGRKKKLKL